MNTNRIVKFVSMGLCLMLVASAGMGCKSKKPVETISTEPTTTTDSGLGDGLPNIDPTKLTFTKSSELETVYFDLDSSALRPDAIAALSRNAQIIKSKPANTYFQVQGNCDERGTQEYNLALGERRALAVRSHLISLGCDGSKIVTISFGEEMPAVPGSGESAWSKNRRAEFGVATAN